MDVFYLLILSNWFTFHLVHLPNQDFCRWKTLSETAKPRPVFVWLFFRRVSDLSRLSQHRWRCQRVVFSYAKHVYQHPQHHTTMKHTHQFSGVCVVVFVIILFNVDIGNATQCYLNDCFSCIQAGNQWCSEGTYYSAEGRWEGREYAYQGPVSEQQHHCRCRCCCIVDTTQIRTITTTLNTCY